MVATCNKCNSDYVRVTDIVIDEDKLVATMSCDECGNDFIEVYKLEYLESFSAYSDAALM